MISLAPENKKAFIFNDSIIRFRNTYRHSMSGTIVHKVKYSVNDVDFIDLDASSHWNYADGQAIVGNTCDSLLLSDSDTKGVYLEGTTSITQVSGYTELDFAIKPTSNVIFGITYYFVIFYRTTVDILPIFSEGHTHASILMVPLQASSIPSFYA
jgi:hypothetical protein